MEGKNKLVIFYRAVGKRKGVTGTVVMGKPIVILDKDVNLIQRRIGDVQYQLYIRWCAACQVKLDPQGITAKTIRGCFCLGDAPLLLRQATYVIDGQLTGWVQVMERVQAGILLPEITADIKAVLCRNTAGK